MILYQHTLHQSYTTDTTTISSYSTHTPNTNPTLMTQLPSHHTPPTHLTPIIHFWHNKHLIILHQHTLHQSYTTDTTTISWYSTNTPYINHTLLTQLPSHYTPPTHPTPIIYYWHNYHLTILHQHTLHQYYSTTDNYHLIILNKHSLHQS